MPQKIIVLFLIVVLTCCSSAPPDKVQGVPEEAFWVGEKSNGHWFTVDSIDQVAKTIYFKIYNDKTGKLVFARRFKLHCYLCEDKINLNNLKDEIMYYEEEKYNNENYIILKTKDADNKNGYFK